MQKLRATFHQAKRIGRRVKQKICRRYKFAEKRCLPNGIEIPSLSQYANRVGLKLKEISKRSRHSYLKTKVGYVYTIW